MYLLLERNINQITNVHLAYEMLESIFTNKIMMIDCISSCWTSDSTIKRSAYQANMNMYLSIKFSGWWMHREFELLSCAPIPALQIITILQNVVWNKLLIMNRVIPQLQKVNKCKKHSELKEDERVIIRFGEE